MSDQPSHRSSLHRTLAFLSGATAMAVGSVAGVTALLPADLPGRGPTIADVAVLTTWVLALGVGHHRTMHRTVTPSVGPTFGDTIRQAVWGGAAFLLLSSLALLVAPVLGFAASRLASSFAEASATQMLRVLLVVPMGIVLALGTGAVTGAMFCRRA